MLILDEIESNGILKKKEEKYGYSYSLEKTWDEAALFAGGKVDMSHSIGAAEIAEMGLRRGITGVTHGVNLTQYPGMVIKSDSEITPSKTGGLQESWNLIVEKQKP